MVLLFAYLGVAAAGDFPAAPALSITQVISGDSAALPGTGVAVVELWATWCGPCIDQLPHLNQLSQDYDSVSFIAVSDEDGRSVTRFWKRQGWTPHFTVAVDPSGNTAARYMGVDGARGIPRSYLVSDGQIVWSGHPVQIDQPLAMVVAGQWSPAQAQFLAALPDLYRQYFEQALAGNAEAAAGHGEAILARADQLPSVLNDLAWNILTDLPDGRRDTALAVRAARAAVRSKPDSAAYLDTLGLALYQSGAVAEAITVQERAVASCDQHKERFCDELQTRLQQFHGN